MAGLAIIDWTVLSSLGTLASDEHADLAGELVTVFRVESAGRMARMR